MIGPPGVGKTMLAIALGLKAVDAGHRVYYTTAAELVARSAKAASEGRWSATMRFWAGPPLLIVDELSYLPMMGEAAAHLFQVISHRYEKGSIILTTSRGIASRGEIFEDTTVAAAILDRLLHRASVLQIDGESYRMRGASREAQRTPEGGRRGWGIFVILDSDCGSARWRPPKRSGHLPSEYSKNLPRCRTPVCASAGRPGSACGIEEGSAGLSGYFDRRGIPDINKQT